MNRMAEPNREMRNQNKIKTNPLKLSHPIWVAISPSFPSFDWKLIILSVAVTATEANSSWAAGQTAIEHSHNNTLDSTKRAREEKKRKKQKSPYASLLLCFRSVRPTEKNREEIFFTIISFSLFYGIVHIPSTTEWYSEWKSKHRQIHFVYVRNRSEEEEEEAEKVCKSNSRICSIRNYCVPKHHYVVIISFAVWRISSSTHISSLHTRCVFSELWLRQPFFASIRNLLNITFDMFSIAIENTLTQHSTAQTVQW